MEPTIKAASMTVLQQRMDKCTSEQIWAVSVLAGVGALVITQRTDILRWHAEWAVLAVLTVLTFYGGIFIIHRHNAYAMMYDTFASLVESEPEENVPGPLKRRADRRSYGHFSGVSFYVFLPVVSLLSTFMTLAGAKSMNNLLPGWERADWLSLLSIVATIVLTILGFIATRKLSRQQTAVQMILAELEMREKAGVILRGADELSRREAPMKHTLLQDSLALLPIFSFPLSPSAKDELIGLSARALCRSMHALRDHDDDEGRPMEKVLADRVSRILPQLDKLGRIEAVRELKRLTGECLADGAAEPHPAVIGELEGRGDVHTS